MSNGLMAGMNRSARRINSLLQNHAMLTFYKIYLLKILLEEHHNQNEKNKTL
jgi:hypothetical protein